MIRFDSKKDMDYYDNLYRQFYDYKLRIEKAIAYMQDNNLSNFDKDLYYILIGGDKID